MAIRAQLSFRQNVNLIVIMIRVNFSPFCNDFLRTERSTEVYLYQLFIILYCKNYLSYVLFVFYSIQC